MKQLVKLIFVFIFTTALFAEDFSEMSTQELIAIMGYVKPANLPKFKAELRSRISSMSQNEKRKYKKNLGKMK
ncbi:MAG: DUF1104 domain-containing protein [Campylobacteraceae bacterium]|nr:DUF1104 domain-containing protein [Campylobacteraceae bacterium]